MNIGILTFHHVYNYGALLQAYALQSFLEEIGHSAEIIDVRPFYRDPPGAPNSRFAKYVWRIARKSGFLRRSKKEIAFDDFRERFLKVSAPYLQVENIPDDYHQSLDTVIVGSDQVWDPRFGPKSLDTYFMRGFPARLKRLAYAACAGSEVSDLSVLGTMKDALGCFDAIGVRDVFTSNAIEAHCEATASIVVDPTLLINWYNVEQERLPAVNGDYIFYYGVSPNGDKVVRQLKASRGYNSVLVGMETDQTAAESHTVVKDAGPAEWVTLVRNSSIVVTKSFHGLMFALKFNKPVLIVPSNKRALSRLKDAAERFGLGGVLIHPDVENFDVESILEGFDLMSVGRRVKAEVNQSRNWLREKLT